jgi:hypothetical protein
MSYDYDDYDPELDGLKNQTAAERRRSNTLLRFPDCRDPDHPGCADCAEVEEGDDEAAV